MDDYIQGKLDGTKEVVKYLRTEIKSLQQSYRVAVEDALKFGGFDDCGESYRQQVAELKSQIDELIHIKIHVEKLRKKVREDYRESIESQTVIDDIN